MEKYELPPNRYYQALCDALECFKAENVFIRLLGSHGGGVKVNEDLRQERLNKSFFVKQYRRGLKIFIDGQEKFLFETTSVKKDDRLSGKCWVIHFVRIDRDGRMHNASTGYPNPQEPHITGPDDRRLPKARQTIFRTANHDHLIEITFAGKIPICRTDRMVIPGDPSWYYWDLDYHRILKKK